MRPEYCSLASCTATVRKIVVCTMCSDREEYTVWFYTHRARGYYYHYYNSEWDGYKYITAKYVYIESEIALDFYNIHSYVYILSQHIWFGQKGLPLIVSEIMES